MRRIDLPLAICLLLYLILAIAYSIVVPIFEGPDEDDHFRYVKFLADHRALPVQQFQPGGGEAGHQGWQPPLYYALAALVISPIDTGDLQERLWRNPAASYTGDRACCGRNLYFHTAAENFPYQRTTLAVHLARGVTIAFGALAVMAIYFLVLTLFPQEYRQVGSPSLLALATTALAVLNPSFLFASALVSNDVPLTALCTLALLAMIKLVTRQWAPSFKHVLLLGTLIALTLLIKTTALGLVPLALVALVLTFQCSNAPILQFPNAPILQCPNASMLRRSTVSTLIALFAPITLLTGWWFLRNQVLYGDPLAYRLVYASAIFPRDAPLTWAELFQINLPWIWQTFWGGPTPGDFPQTLLLALLILLILAAVGLARYFFRQWRTLTATQMLAFGLLAAWLAFILLAQLQFLRLSSGTDQGRYLFPAIASFSLFTVLGLNESISHFTFYLSRLAFHISRLTFHASRFTFHVSRFTFYVSPYHLITALMVILPIYVLFAFTLPAYATPPPFDPARLDPAVTRLDVVFKNGMALQGYTLDRRALHCSERLAVTLYWSAQRKIPKSYRTFVHLVNAQGVVAGGKDVIPYRGAYATVLWQPGEWVVDTIEVPINRGARAGDYRVIVGLYPFGEPDNRVNLVRDADFVTLGEIRLNAPPEGCR